MHVSVSLDHPPRLDYSHARFSDLWAWIAVIELATDQGSQVTPPERFAPPRFWATTPAMLLVTERRDLRFRSRAWTSATSSPLTSRFAGSFSRCGCRQWTPSVDLGLGLTPSDRLHRVGPRTSEGAWTWHSGHVPQMYQATGKQGLITGTTGAGNVLWAATIQVAERARPHL